MIIAEDHLRIKTRCTYVNWMTIGYTSLFYHVYFLNVGPLIRQYFALDHD